MRHILMMSHPSCAVPRVSSLMSHPLTSHSEQRDNRPTNATNASPCFQLEHCHLYVLSREVVDACSERSPVTGGREVVCR